MSVKRIAAHLGVSVGSVSIWVRDVETPPKPERSPKRSPTAGRPRTPDVPDVGGPRRRCGRCGEELPLSAFNRAGDGHQHWCRDCFTTYFRERGDRHREQSRAARELRRQAARQLVREHFAAHPCVDCGEDELLVLEFDHHRSEKDADVARLVAAGVRPERLRREIERREVVCVNCHRRRTATRAGSFRATGVPAATWTVPQHRNAAFVVEVLRASGCCDCGETDPVVLDFDHLGEKHGGVPTLALRWSLARLQGEIERCVVRCANCHRVRTLTTSDCWRAEGSWAEGLHLNPSET